MGKENETKMTEIELDTKQHEYETKMNDKT